MSFDKELGINKSFLLKNIDPYKVALNLLMGRINVPTNRVNFNANVLKPDFIIGSDCTSEIYETSNSYGDKIRIVTVGHGEYNNHLNTTNKSDENICSWCRIKFTTNPLVLPIKIQKMNNNIIVHGTGKYCSFECAYARIKLQTNCNLHHRDFFYADSETLLLMLYHLYYRNTDQLQPAPDWDLLDINGGPLTKEQYHSKVHYYSNVPNIILLPIKKEYMIIQK